MSIAVAVKHMLAAGMDADAIVAAVDEMESAQQPKRTARQERNRRYYQKRKADASEKRLNKTVKTVSDALDTPSSPEVSPHTPLPNPSNPNTPFAPLKGGSSPTKSGEFAEFWSAYPHKVGKRDAEKAFAKARTRASFDAIMAGLRRYAAKTDDRPWCNPATFLNQDRWEDAPSEAPQHRQGQPPPRSGSFRQAIRELSGSARNEPDQPDTRHHDTGNGGADRAGSGTVIDLLALPGRR